MEKAVSFEFPYCGKRCSVNHAYIRGRILHPGAKAWRDALAICAHIQLVTHEPRAPLTIKLFGRFRNKRECPDLANLHKLIGDAIQDATGIDDREFLFVDEGYELGIADAQVRITVEWVAKEESDV